MTKQIFRLLEKEKKRQEETLMMIPSENYTYPEVRQALASWTSHKYSEGQPGKRYYQGNEFIDQIESLCQKEALWAFDLDETEWDVNVQPYSGSIANLAVYTALIKPGEKILAMNLLEGGHVSHGWQWKGKPVGLAGQVWQFHHYGVDPEKEIFDYGKIGKMTQEIQPKLVVSGGTAYPREIDHQELSQIAKENGAYYLADIAHEAGLIAAGVNQSPFQYADVVTMTGQKTLRGPRCGIVFARKGLIELINRAIFPGIQGGPHNQTIAALAIAFQKAQTEEFKKDNYQTVKNCQKLGQILSSLGLRLVSGGTDKHLLLIDLQDKNVSGWFTAWALEAAGIIVNRNTIPRDPASPYYPSGFRLGTPACTVRGMGEKEMEVIGKIIVDVVEHLGSRSIPEDKKERTEKLKNFKKEVFQDQFLQEVKQRVIQLCQKFPIPE